MPTNTLTDADTRFDLDESTLTLRATRYRYDAATREDDGIIDTVVVDRFVDGETVPLSSRELVCVVARFAEQGFNDWAIAERFGRHTEAGAAWVYSIRRRNGIVSTFDGPSAATRREADRRPRRLDSGFRRFPLSAPMELIYGLTGGMHTTHSSDPRAVWA